MLTLAGAALGRDGTALITIQSVPATVIRGALKFEAAEGLPLEPEDIIETLPFTSLTRLELDDGTTVDLGPSSRVLLRPQWAQAGGNDGPVVYLLDGWAKVSQLKAGQGKAIVASPFVDVTGMARDVVIHAHGAEAEVFAESGWASLLVRDKSGKATPVKLEASAFLARHVDGSTDTSPRPQPAFIQAVPRPFMDTLPALAARFKGKDVRPGATGKIDYADVDAWLNAEPRIRTRFVTRWRALAQNEAFRKPLTAQLPQHPEWRPVLFPPQAAHKPAMSAQPASSNVKFTQ
jgi:hypothetical protein